MLEHRYLTAARTDDWFAFRGHLLHECFRQEYSGNNCIFAGGVVKDADPPVDTIYLCIEKDGADATLLLLRPDEATAISIALNSALWSQQIEDVQK